MVRLEKTKPKEGGIPETAKNILSELNKKDIKEALKKFQLAKYTLLGFIQTVMLGGDIKPYM